MLYGLQMEIVIDPLDKKLTKKITSKGLETECESIKCAAACQDDWEEHGGHCYLWSDSQLKKSWADAEEFCQKKGGHLASVTSEAINEYIFEEKRKRGLSSHLWLGGTDMQMEGVWRWSDGSTWKFSAWKQGQPNNGSKEHCLIQVGHNVKEWNDYWCTDENNFVCSQTLCSGRNII